MTTVSVSERSWNAEANTLGYESEKQMMHDLYVVNNFSIAQMAEMLGYSFFSVRKRLQSWGISLKRRGGPNNHGKRRLATITKEELMKQSPTEIAKKYDVCVATVFAEKRFRAVSGEAR